MVTAASPLDALIPIIVALFKQSGLPARFNAWIALAVYFVWTAVSLWFNLRGITVPVTPEIFVQQFVAACVTGFVSYMLVFKNLPGDAEAKLTMATSFFKGPSEEPVTIENEKGTPAASGLVG